MAAVVQQRSTHLVSAVLLALNAAAALSSPSGAGRSTIDGGLVGRLPVPPATRPSIKLTVPIGVPRVRGSFPLGSLVRFHARW